MYIATKFYIEKQVRCIRNNVRFINTLLSKLFSVLYFTENINNHE